MCVFVVGRRVGGLGRVWRDGGGRERVRGGGVCVVWWVCGGWAVWCVVWAVVGA